MTFIITELSVVLVVSWVCSLLVTRIPTNCDARCQPLRTSGQPYRYVLFTHPLLDICSLADILRNRYPTSSTGGRRQRMVCVDLVKRCKILKSSLLYICMKRQKKIFIVGSKKLTFN